MALLLNEAGRALLSAEPIAEIPGSQCAHCGLTGDSPAWLAPALLHALKQPGTGAPAFGGGAWPHPLRGGQDRGG